MLSRRKLGEVTKTRVEPDAHNFGFALKLLPRLR